MELLRIEGLTELTVEDSDSAREVRLALEHHMGGRERTWMNYDEVVQLVTWLLEWMGENEGKKGDE